MSIAREEIFRRITLALDGESVPVSNPVSVGPMHLDSADAPPVAAEAPQWVRLFAERCSEYSAEVHVPKPGGLALTIGAICAAHQAGRLACPIDVPTRWKPQGVEFVSDDPRLSPQELDELDGVLTGCRLAVAETGTIMLDHGRCQGRRALTLIPDLHLCVVTASQVVSGIADVRPTLQSAIGEGRPVTLVSGPSATSDIELVRVEGVHGPRRLEIIVVDDPIVPSGCHET